MCRIRKQAGPQYLSREANLATLRAISAWAAAGSELVFTYIDQRELDAGSQSSIQGVRSSAAGLGESWLSGFDPAQLAGDLRQVGLRLIEDLGGEDVWRRYCTDEETALRSPAVRIARASVA